MSEMEKKETAQASDSQKEQPVEEKLHHLIESVKKQGHLESQELMTVLEDMELTPEQTDKFYEALENLGVDIASPEEVEDVPIEIDEELPESEELQEIENLQENEILDTAAIPFACI